jgi:thiol-disulfide isomerase/thioredoxin
MPDLRHPIGAAALVVVAGLLLAGCASAAPTAAPEAPSTGSPTASEPSEPNGSGSASDPDAAQAGAYVDYRDGIIDETPGAKAIFFHASWCPQCRALEESILAGDIPDGLTIIKADFDSETDLRQEYGVTLQTTIVYVGDDGESLGSTVLYDDTSLDALVAAAP